MWEGIRANRLNWLPELGIGYFPPRSFVYDSRYFESYLGRDATPTGAALTAARIAFVREYWRGKVLDVGIGGGRFVDESGGVGYDVNPAAINWLRARGIYHDPAVQGPVEAATFWDSLEHMLDPAAFLQHIRQWAFVSIPMFIDVDHVLGSKHYKPDEHVWYFTFRGLVTFMLAQGFDLVAHNRMEEQCGREDICTLAFRRAL